MTDSSGNLIGGADANGSSNAVVVAVFPTGYSSVVATILPPGQTLCQVSPTTCSTSVVFHGPIDSVTGNSTINVGQDFSPMAIDRAGNLYVVWAQSTVDPASGNITSSTQIYMAVSTNKGATWGAPVNVTAATPTLLTNVFPWIAAGDSGRVDIVWYGTTTLGSCPNQPCGSGGITGQWQVMMAQSLNTVVNGVPNPTPTFATVLVSEIPNHYGAICTFGIGCTTGGDRGLLDFLSVNVGLQGEANVVWADAVNQNLVSGTSSAVIAFNRQVSGPSLFSSVGQVTGPAPANGKGTGSVDAFYSANGTTLAASTNLVIQSASITKSNPTHYKITIQVQDLTTLAVSPTLGGTDAVWLVRWEVPGTNAAGHLYFAGMESDGGAAPTFFDGESSSIDTTHGKFLTYPPAHTITGSYTATAPGVITLTVPIADVGGNAKAVLYSLTGLTVTQLTTSSSGPIFNQIDATVPFDFKP